MQCLYIIYINVYVCTASFVYYNIVQSACIYILQVNTEFAAGRYEEAKIASDIAKNINYVALGIGVCLFFLYMGIIAYDVISVLNTSAQNDYQPTAN